MSIYFEVKELLQRHGWTIDLSAEERPDRELHEFVHPETGKKMAWLDALVAEHEREALP